MTAPTFSAEIARNSREALKVSLQTTRGVTVRDARIWADASFGPTTSRCPTKHGFTLALASIPDLITALQGAHAEALALGLLETTDHD